MITTTSKNIIPIPILIIEARRGNQRIQKLLYEQYADKMYDVCFRYTKNAADAEDILQEGFLKIFRNLDKYRGEGSFEGWVRKIITRTALTHLSNNKKYSNHTGLNYHAEDKENNILDKLAEKEIVSLVTNLPPGYRKIFMLYVMEG